MGADQLQILYSKLYNILQQHIRDSIHTCIKVTTGFRYVISLSHQIYIVTWINSDLVEQLELLLH